MGDILRRYPDRVPVIIDENSDFQIDKRKYLVPVTMTMGNYITYLRKRIQIDSSEAMFVLINNILPPISATFDILQAEHADGDGFLNIRLQKENAFGAGDHWQDWNTVVLKKPKPQTFSPSPKEPKEPGEMEKVQHTSLELRKQIQAARTARKLSQAQLAQQINEKPNIIQAYESGKAVPSPQILQKLRRILGVKLNSK